MHLSIYILAIVWGIYAVVGSVLNQHSVAVPAESPLQINLSNEN